MKILVAVKRVPNPEHKLAFADGHVQLGGAPYQVNPFDEYAVETALRLTEKGKGGERAGEVVVASVGPKDSAQLLRGLLAMGADRAILVDGDDARLDAAAVARALAAIAAAEKPDLIVLGKQTVDGEGNQVGQILAARLGWSQATFLAGVTVAADGKTARALREVDAGVEEKIVRLPAVLTVDLRVVGKSAVRNLALVAPDAAWDDGPRYAALKGIMAAKKKEIRELDAAALGVALEPATRTLRHDPPPARQAGVKVASVDELVRRLVEEAKVL